MPNPTNATMDGLTYRSVASPPSSLEVHPISVPSSFDFEASLRTADTTTPPITLEQDLGPHPISHDLFQELFGGDLSDYTDSAGSGEDSEEDLFSTPSVPDVSPPSSSSFATRRLRLDCVEIPVPPRSKGKQKHRQNPKNARRRERRREHKVTLGARRRFNPSGAHVSRVIAEATPLSVKFDAQDMDAARGAHTGKIGKKVEKKEDSLRRLLAQGFKHVKWDGCTPKPIVDKQGRIIAVLCGRPTSGHFKEAMDGVYAAVMEEGRKAPLGDQEEHRRGSFPAFNVGCTMGMGSSEPVALNTHDMAPVLARLLQHRGVRRLAGYHNAAFSLWAPRLYAEYQRVAQEMYRRNTSLPRNFSDGVFTAATFNFGGNVCTYKHRDFFNWAFGWCFITALGKFDATRGGQLVMWELKLVVDFPHAATIALPSAVITHSNVPIAPGPIFRWVENGCRTEREMEADDPKEFQAMMAKKSTAYLDRLPLYSTLDELATSVQAL
ncbi:hypothetical protein VNI00_016544 [Paramarasmius palmivorus]|uniref:Uncharacterized protein n=1 Tax=Paramarasmius palmivorus TaxID=297713 RepID=A0AAW0BFS8_9AGAR